MTTLEQNIRDWLDTVKRMSVKRTTFDRVEKSYKSFINYPIAKIPISRLTTRDMQTYINTLTNEGFSQSTIKKQFHLVSAYVNYALGEGYPIRAICNNVHLPAQTQLKTRATTPEASSYRGEHVFRHTFATNCYYKGVDVKILSRHLGHADVNITYNIYIHLYGDGFDELYTALVP